MRDQRTKLALKLACLFVFPLELQLVSQSLLRTMELNNFWMNILVLFAPAIWMTIFLMILLYISVGLKIKILENLFPCMSSASEFSGYTPGGKNMQHIRLIKDLNESLWTLLSHGGQCQKPWPTRQNIDPGMVKKYLAIPKIHKKQKYRIRRFLVKIQC